MQPDYQSVTPNASHRMAEKFHIGARHVYEIWNNNDRLQQVEQNHKAVLETPAMLSLAPTSIEQGGHVSEKNENKGEAEDDTVSYSDPLSDLKKLIEGTDLKNLLEDTERLDPMHPFLPL
ncbi:9697_t:CDS:2, partial [Racocetra fulgida]